MPKIIISPYSRKLRNGNNNPKNYPFWADLVKGLCEKNYYVIQVGVEGEEKIEGVDEIQFNKPLEELITLLKECGSFISVDNFFQHLAYVNGISGYVIFGQSDPNIFGHEEHCNFLKDRKYLRKAPFDIWERAEYLTECFVEPSVIIDRISKGA